MASIYVPMLLDAYVNYDPNLQPAQSSDRAYLAPLKTPNFQSLQFDSTRIQHDIYEDFRDPPYLSNQDRTRTQPSRQGVYIHWTLPKAYRQGILASQSGIDAAKQAASAAGHNPDSVKEGSTVYREVPTRWFVRRRLQSRDSGSFAVQRFTNSTVGVYTPNTTSTLPMPGGILCDYYMIESVGHDSALYHCNG